MTLHTITFCLVALLVLGCAHSNSGPGNSPPANSLGETDKSNSEKQIQEARARAETFDKFLWGKLSPEESSALVDACQIAPEKNLFCYSVARFETLDRRVKARLKVPHHPEPKPIEPLAPHYVGSRIQNWRDLRHGSVKRLLKGLEGFTLAQLRPMAHRALRDHYCPNAIAIAVAASMEDFLPEQVDVGEIAPLYERGAACSGRFPADEENYLTRAGLLYYLKKDYRKAAALFHRSTNAGSSFSGRALYWLARSRELLGDKTSAKSAYDQLISKYPFSFHALIAQVAQSKDPGGLMLKSSPLTENHSQRVPALNNLITQAEELHRFGFDASAAIISDWALDTAPRAEAKVKLHLAGMADDRTKVIAVGDLLNRYPSLVSRDSLELYFPKAFWSLFEKNSLDLNPYLLMSVARQESTFNPKAISLANAQGLLQIHPDTSLKVTSGTVVDLLDPQANISVGAKYLTQLISQLNGKIYLVLAAYNAGIEKLTIWTHRYPEEDPVLFVDLISFKETRNYVAAVLRNYFWYRRIFGPANPQAWQSILDPELTKASLSASSATPTPNPSPSAAPKSIATPSPTLSPSPTPSTVPLAKPLPTITPGD